MNMYLLQPLLKYKKTLLSLVATTTAIGGFVWKYDLRLIVPMIALTPNQLWGLRVGMTLILIIMSLLSLLYLSLYAFKKSAANESGINLQEFNFVDPPGYYTHQNYSYSICQNCLIKDKLVSPVSQIDQNTWFCNICGKYFPGGKGEVFTVDW